VPSPSTMADFEKKVAESGVKVVFGVAKGMKDFRLVAIRSDQDLLMLKFSIDDHYQFVNCHNLNTGRMESGTPVKF